MSVLSPFPLAAALRPGDQLCVHRASQHRYDVATRIVTRITTQDVHYNRKTLRFSSTREWLNLGTIESYLRSGDWYVISMFPARVQLPLGV